MIRFIFFVLCLFPISLHAKDFHQTGPAYDREEITCHLPEQEHLPNAAGRDGFGLCVFTSLELAAKWSNEPALFGFRDFMTKHPGGGWPEKVDQFIPKISAHNGLPPPEWVQHVGGDATFLRRALQAQRYVCVTYDGRDGVFYPQRVAHMVNLVHLSDRYAVIQDNNFPGKWLWMAPEAFLERWRGTGGGWAIVLLRHGPPPIPVNRIGEAQPRPKPLAAISEGENLNFGVGLHALSHSSQYRLNGRVVPRADALAALDRPSADHAWRLTIVGDLALRQQVRADWATHPALATWRNRLQVQDYDPTTWAVADVGMAPGLTLQGPAQSDGKAAVRWRMTTYPGPEALAAALRKADPTYRPELDPDPTQPEAEPTKPPLDVTPTPIPAPSRSPPMEFVWWVVGGFAFGQWFARGRKVP